MRLAGRWEAGRVGGELLGGVASSPWACAGVFQTPPSLESFRVTLQGLPRNVWFENGVARRQEGSEGSSFKTLVPRQACKLGADSPEGAARGQGGGVFQTEDAAG